MEFLAIKEEINRLESYKKLDMLSKLGIQTLNELYLLLKQRTEFIEMLKELLLDLEEVNIPTSILDTITRAEQLIKEATEL